MPRGLAPEHYLWKKVLITLQVFIHILKLQLLQF